MYMYEEVCISCSLRHEASERICIKDVVVSYLCLVCTSPLVGHVYRGVITRGEIDVLHWLLHCTAKQDVRLMRRAASRGLLRLHPLLRHRRGLGLPGRRLPLLRFPARRPRDARARASLETAWYSVARGSPGLRCLTSPVISRTFPALFLCDESNTFDKLLRCMSLTFPADASRLPYLSRAAPG